MEAKEPTKTMEGKQNTEATTKPTKVLVVGDWFVDEHWVTGIHRSSTASRTGKAHFRSLHKLSSPVESFCGAGRPASLLYQIKDKKTSENNENSGCQFEIEGIGLWHESDTNTLKEMFDFENLKGNNPFRIGRATPKRTADKIMGVNLHNLFEVTKDREGHCEACTTRIIRIYQATGSRDFKFERIDWELPPIQRGKHGLNVNSVEWISEADLTPGNSIAKNLEQLLNGITNVGAVVIKDLLRGVISRALIKKLVEKFPDCPWFISSKAWSPPWFEEIRKIKDLRLILIPQVAAREALKSEDMSSWITKGVPDEDAIVQMQAIHDRVGYGHKELRIIVLPKGFSVIGWEASQNGEKEDSHGGSSWKDPVDLDEQKEDCVVQPQEFHDDLAVDMGMASVLLPALISKLLSPQNKKSNLKSLVEDALYATYLWVKFEGGRIQKPDEWDATSRTFMQLQDEEKDANPYKCNLYTLHAEELIWKQATDGTGVIRTKKRGKNQNKLELWRGMLEVEGYICCVKEKRKELRRLRSEIKEFGSGSQKRVVAGMLKAPPGSGKTTLVRNLAESLDMKFLPFNITQMFLRTDILDCFDSIVTTQSQNPGRKLLVFVDEINALLENETVYNAFLAPIEDGVYIRGGKAFQIEPCIWIFSGTSDPRAEGGGSSKGSDFVSRLTLGIIDIANPSPTRQKVENVYLGVALVRKEFPDVRAVSQKVLRTFHYMGPIKSVREINNFVKSFTDIQYGKVWSHNIPRRELEQFKKNHYEFNLQKWDDKDRKEDENELVEIA